MFNATGAPESTAELKNYPFFPDLKIQEFRDAMRVDNVATMDRAAHALLAAMMEANRRLAGWMLDQIEGGINALVDAEPGPGQPEGEKEQLYLRAVYCLAKANLVERYRDYDSTGNASGRADQLEESIDDLRRDAAWAINDITGLPRSTVELI